MAEVELKLTMDAAEASSAVSGFRKEYQGLVKAIQAPLRQIDALQKTTENAKAATSAYFNAKRRVDELKRAIEQAGQPVRELDRAYSQAQRTLASSTREFERQKVKVREQRAELKAAGVDVRNLAAEQKRLQASLVGAVGQGQADAAITRALDTFGINRLRALREQLVTLRSDYARLSQSGQMAATERIGAEIRYQAALSRTQKQIRELTTGDGDAGGDGGIAAITGRIAALTAAAYALQRIAGFYFNAADAVGELEDRMRNALPVQEEYERAQARLESISRRVRVPIAQVTELFLGTLKPLSEMGFSAAQTTDMVGALTAGLVANSVKGDRAAAVIDNISKAMQTGYIRGDAFNSILQNSGAITDALTRSLGVSRAELIRMANSGELTTEKFVMAISDQSEALLKLADNMRNTAGDASGTFSQAIEKLIGRIDKLTGASAAAIEQLDKVSDAINDIADGKNQRSLELLGNALIAGGKGLGTLLPGAGALARTADAYRQFSDDSADALEDLTDAEGLARTDSERIKEQRLADERAYASEFGKEQEKLTNAFKTAVNDQVAAQNRANAKLKKAQDAQLATAKRYREALQKLGAGAAGPESFSSASSLRVAARQALQAGDAEKAKKLAQQSLDMLMKLAEAGENTYGFEGFIKGLQGIEEAADKAILASAEASRKAEIDKVRELKKEFEDLKNFKLTPTIDDAALAKETEKMKRWAAMIGESFVIRPRTYSAESGAPTEWHAPMALPGKTATPAAQSEPKPVAAPVKPTTIVQDSSTSEALPPVKAPVTPTTIRQDGPASWTNLPAAEVAITPKGVRQDAVNSWTNLPPVEVDILPKGIRKDGENSFTNLPVEADLVVKQVTAPEGELPVVPALLKPVGPAPEVEPVPVASQVDEVSKAGVLQEFGAFIEQLKKMSVVPLTLSMVPPASAGGDVKGYSGGGYTGPGGRYDPAGIVHKGEVVWSQLDVARAGGVGVVEALRRGLRGYDMGGIVAPRNPPSIPQMAPALQEQLAGGGREFLGDMNIVLPGGQTMQVSVPTSQAENLKLLRLQFGRTHK